MGKSSGASTTIYNNDVPRSKNPKELAKAAIARAAAEFLSYMPGIATRESLPKADSMVKTGYPSIFSFRFELLQEIPLSISIFSINTGIKKRQHEKNQVESAARHEKNTPLILE